jgi:PGF-CTERM protein
MEQNMKTFGVILATLAMIASVLVMPVASAEDGDLQATISGDDGTTSFASENGTAVFTVDISSASGASHTDLVISVTFDGAGWTSDQASVDDCAGGSDLNFTGSGTACISVMVMGAESVGGSVGMSVSVTSAEDTTGASVTGAIKISNWRVSSVDGIQSYSELVTHQYTITVENIMVDAEGAGLDLDEPVYITLVEIGGGWNVESDLSAWDKPSLTATINFIPADNSFDLVLDIQLVGEIVTSSSYTGAPATIGFNAFDESETPVTTFIFLHAEIATFNGVAITSSSDESDVWDPSTTQVDNGCSGIDAAIGFVVTVDNFGNDRDSFDVTFDTSDAGSAGWAVNNAETFTTELLEPKANDGTHTFTLGLVVPANLAAGTTHGFSMTATSTVDNSISQTQTFSATVKQCYQFDLTVDSMMNSANPGSSTDFTFTVSNTGNGDDTFTYMTMGAAAWNPSLASTETEIASGATGQNVLSVTVPADASSDAVSGMIMVHAYSEACGDDRTDCDYEASKTVSVSANQVFALTAGYFSNETDIVKSSASVEEGMSVQMKVTVTNNGNGIDQVTLSLANAPSWVSISDDPILVGPGLTETISITAMAPVSDADGDYTFQVTATSSDNTVTSTTGDLTITITEKGSATGPTTDDVEEDDSPGFGAISAIAALGAVLLLRRRS